MTHAAIQRPVQNALLGALPDAEFERIATVDVQPHYFGGMLDRADLVIDHHPEQPGYSAVFKDIRAYQ